jgi:hypothetical protein
MAEKNFGGKPKMAKNVSVIGMSASELCWVRTLVGLLRHPDPSIPELARQALLYLGEAAQKRVAAHPATVDQAG